VVSFETGPRKNRERRRWLSDEILVIANPAVLTFPINDTVLALTLPYLEDFASEIGGLNASDFLAGKSL
jgi:hypothetical protein